MILERIALALALLVPIGCASRGGASGTRPASDALAPVPFDRVTITDAFWKPRIETNRRVTVGACLDQCEETGRIANFARTAGLEQGPHQGALYNDSDVYKVLEGAAYTLRAAPDPELEARVDRVIDLIAAAQQPDGYLNTYWTLAKPGERWTNIAHGHELYCAGHLIEAAIAYRHATGKRKLLDVAIRFADHVDSEFGPGKRLDPPGHQELELALAKLARETGDERYLRLAAFFLGQRGRPEGRAKLFGEYAQDHLPVREQREIVGHAVRAMYMYCAMADVASATGDRRLWAALQALWHDVVDTKMYVTGGIGSSASNEGISTAFDLPNDTAYCETCAAIGMALWNQRMFLATGDAKYADVVERELYNGFLAGVSLGGDRFFYDNPLASRGDHQRVPWFDCSCCPTNVVRFLPAIGERIYAQRRDELYVSLFAGSETEVELDGGKVRIRQETEYPWKGDVLLRLEPENPFVFDLKLRIPGWADTEVDVAVAGARPDPGQTSFESGFVRIRREWRAGDTVLLRLPMEPKRVHADPRVKADVGRVALMRGPLVYCLEACDNGGTARNLVLPRDASLFAGTGPDARLGGAVILGAMGGRRVASRRIGSSDGDVALSEAGVDLIAVPYALWANREPGEMVVWIAEGDAYAEPPGSEGLDVGGMRVTASHCHRGDTVAAVADGALPKSSIDHDVPRHTFWDHRGTSEWLQYEFAEPRTVSRASVYWFDDTGRGSCRVPKSWRLAYRDGEDWKPVRVVDGGTYGVARDAPQRIAFEPVSTGALRLEVELQPGVSAGVLEWSVE